MFKTKTGWALGLSLGSFEFKAFGFWYCFEFRISDFSSKLDSFVRFSPYEDG